MLHIRQTKHLLATLGVTQDALLAVLGAPNDYYEELQLRDPQKPNKLRTVVNVKGTMRTLQSRLYRRVLLPKLEPSAYSHGGVRGRSIKTNVEPHLGAGFVFRTDISDFYPSVHYRRVYRLFSERLRCSPDVSRLCTRICTFRHHLALGLICSPILADQIMDRIDRRIGGACAKAQLTYTRFVDDIAISGPFNLERSGFARLIEEILTKDGFQVNPSKHVFGRLTDDCTITNLREVRGHMDVRSAYLDELVRQIKDASELANDLEFEGPYYTASQIWGRVRFVCWVNPGRKRELVRRFRSVNWKAVRALAQKRGYEVCRKTLTKTNHSSGR
jgi:RNA-directed DNA polymerase